MSIETSDWVSDSAPLLQLTAVALLLITFASSSTDILPATIGDIFTFTAYVAFVGILVHRSRSVRLPVFPTLTVGLIYIIFVVNGVRHFLNLMPHPEPLDNSLSTTIAVFHLGDILAYIIGSFVVLFLIPHTVRREHIFTVFAGVSTFSLVVGIPAYFIGDYTLLSMYVNTYTNLEPFRQFGIYIPALSSIWDDANAMSKIAVAGIIGSHYLYVMNRSRRTGGLVAFNVFGLMLANSKMAIIAILSAYSVYFVYELLGERATYTYLVATGTTGVLAFIAIVIGLGTDALVAEIGFAGRVDLWRASLYTFGRHPVLGVGIHDVGIIIAAYTDVAPLAPQNSYLRILVATGIFGGVAYITLVITTAFRYVRQIGNRKDAIVFTLLVAFIIIQFTDTADPFGMNKNALIFGLPLGYAIKAVYFGSPVEVHNEGDESLD